MNDFRLSYIRKAYEKLDLKGDGKVTMDDIAKLYDVSKNPDIINHNKTPEQVYKEFLSLWDT